MNECCSAKPAGWPAVMSCPLSGRRSRLVDLLTVRSLVRQLPLGMPASAYYFCDDPACDVVYFPSNPQAPRFHRADLWVRVGVKEKADPIPVCYCFGVSQSDILDEIRETGRSTVAERITAEARAGNCACEAKNPSGRCCLGDVTRTVQSGIRKWSASHDKLKEDPL
jgi:hypothetical protein